MFCQMFFFQLRNIADTYRESLAFPCNMPTMRQQNLGAAALLFLKDSMWLRDPVKVQILNTIIR